jgi:TolA-binding protein
MNKFPPAVLVSLCLTLVSCGQDQYSIEREYYQAKKQVQIILNDPHATPPDQLQNTVDTLNDFIHQHPKSNLALEAQFNIAKLYIATQAYEKGRSQLNKIIQTYSKFRSVCAEAFILKGNSYEAQNRWDMALGEYNHVIESYPLTEKGLEAPIYIAMHYKTKYQPDEMTQAFRQAIKHYDSLAESHPMTPLALHLNILTAQCYADLEDWNNVIAAFNAMLRKYKGKARLDEILIDLAMVYDQKLHDKVKTKETLEKLLQDYPTSQFRPLVQSMLKKTSP